MCCICGCIASILDMIQRAITFMLACWLACVVCCGLIFAAAAGVAYGYNYSVAEFISLTSSDVTVYLRRGKFSDTPELKYKPRPVGRRSGGDAFEGDDSSANLTTEFVDGGPREPPAERRSLSEAWVKAEDTRKYGEWVAKYGRGATTAAEHADSADSAAPADAPNPYYVATNIPPTRSRVSRSHVSSADSNFASTALFIRRFMSETTPAQPQHARRPDHAEAAPEYETDRIPRIVTTAQN